METISTEQSPERTIRNALTLVSMSYGPSGEDYDPRELVDAVEIAASYGPVYVPPAQVVEIATSVDLQ